ncbi:MAG: hypothetical protein ACREQK_07370, partial [Candidatus Binatia bacterium]
MTGFGLNYHAATCGYLPKETKNHPAAGVPGKVNPFRIPNKSLDNKSAIWLAWLILVEPDWRDKSMADQAESEVLIDVRVAEASRLYKFYLNQEKKILGTVSVVLFLTTWELVGGVFQLVNPMFMSAP